MVHVHMKDTVHVHMKLIELDSTWTVLQGTYVGIFNSTAVYWSEFFLVTSQTILIFILVTEWRTDGLN